jgi:hypothetical protein
MIVDAGGGTVDISSYRMTAPNKYEEVAPPDCKYFCHNLYCSLNESHHAGIFQGSVYVTKRTEAYLKGELSSSFHYV